MMKLKKRGDSCIYKFSPLSSSSSSFPSIPPSSRHSPRLIPPTLHFPAMVLPRGSWVMRWPICGSPGER